MDGFSWTPRARLIAIGLAGLLVLMVAVFVAASNRDDETVRAGPGASAAVGPTGGPSDAVNLAALSQRRPVDPAKAEIVAARFAVRFSNYLPTGPESPKDYLTPLMPYASQDLLTIVQNQFDAYWWELNRSGLGATNAEVVAVTTLWEKPDAISYRVQVDREVRSYLGQPERNHLERVSWDLVVTSPQPADPRVSGCLRTDPRPGTELSDPYGPGEADGE